MPLNLDMRKRIVAFGEIVWDILPDKTLMGGTPVNLAFRCNSFGDEGNLLSRLGYDNSGKTALDKLEKLGLSIKHVQIDDEFPTGTVQVSFDSDNEPVYQVTPDVAFDHIEFSADALKLVRNADCLFYGLLPQRFGISKNTLKELINESPDAIHFFDLKLFEHFFDVKVVEQLLRSSEIVRIKEKEVDFLINQLKLEAVRLEDFVQEISKKYRLDMVLITRGKKGVLAYHYKKGTFSDAGYDIDVRDNIGSGMAFCGAFLYLYLRGKSIQEALDFGNAAGALNTTKQGATNYFGKEEVLEFMTNTPQRR